MKRKATDWMVTFVSYVSDKYLKNKNRIELKNKKANNLIRK